jgi:hypothetical protein
LLLAYLTRARLYSWKGISHEGSETLNLGTERKKKKKTGETMCKKLGLYPDFSILKKLGPIYLMEPLLMEATLHTPADVVNGISL